MTFTVKQRVAMLARMDPEQRVNNYIDLRNEVDYRTSRDLTFYNSQAYNDLLDELQCYWSAMADDEREKAKRELKGRGP